MYNHQNRYYFFENKLQFKNINHFFCKTNWISVLIFHISIILFCFSIKTWIEQKGFFRFFWKTKSIWILYLKTKTKTKGKKEKNEICFCEFVEFCQSINHNQYFFFFAFPIFDRKNKVKWTMKIYWVASEKKKKKMHTFCFKLEENQYSIKKTVNFFRVRLNDNLTVLIIIIMIISKWKKKITSTIWETFRVKKNEFKNTVKFLEKIALIFRVEWNGLKTKKKKYYFDNEWWWISNDFKAMNQCINQRGENTFWTRIQWHSIYDRQTNKSIPLNPFFVVVVQ